MIILHASDRPAGRSIRPDVPDIAELVEHDISTDLGIRAFHPLLDLVEIRIDQLGPLQRSTRLGQATGVA